MDISWVPINEVEDEDNLVEVESSLGIAINMSEKEETRVVKLFTWACPRCNHTEKRSKVPNDLIDAHCWYCRHVNEKGRKTRQEAKRRVLTEIREWEIARESQRLFSDLDLSRVALKLILNAWGGLHSIVVTPLVGDKLLILKSDRELNIRSKEDKIYYVNEYSVEGILLSSKDMADIEEQVMKIQ